MKDRIPAAGMGGRVSLAPENFTVAAGVLSLTASDGAIYGSFGLADNASEAGSIYNKASVLPANVTAALGLDDATAEPADAFTTLNNRVSSANSAITAINSNTPTGVYSILRTVGHRASVTNYNTGKKDVVIRASFTPFSGGAADTAYTDITVSGVGTFRLSYSWTFETSGVTGVDSLRVWKEGGLLFVLSAAGFKCYPALSGNLVISATAVNAGQSSSIAIYGR